MTYLLTTDGSGITPSPFSQHDSLETLKKALRHINATQRKSFSLRTSRHVEATTSLCYEMLFTEQDDPTYTVKRKVGLDIVLIEVGRCHVGVMLIHICLVSDTELLCCLLSHAKNGVHP